MRAGAGDFVVAFWRGSSWLTGQSINILNRSGRMNATRTRQLPRKGRNLSVVFLPFGDLTSS